MWKSVYYSSQMIRSSLKPSNRFFSWASLIKPTRPSTTILNRNGANGSPCLSTLWGVNSVVGLPLTNMEIEADFRQPSIHVIHLKQNPVRLIIYNRKSQQTESVSDSRPCLIVCLFTTHEVVTRSCSFTFPLIFLYCVAYGVHICL